MNALQPTKEKRRRKTLIAFLVLVAFLFTSTTYAYWATSVEGISKTEVQAITVGYASSVATTFDLTNELNSGGFLVPKSQVENSDPGAVDTIHLAYDLAWQEASEPSQLDGTESIGAISITHGISITQDRNPLSQDAYQEIYQLIHVEANPLNPAYLTLDADAKTFYFSITMDEPANQRAYDLIANAEISIVFSFRIYDNFITTTDQSIQGPKMILDGEDTMYVELGDDFLDPTAYAIDSEGNTFNNIWTSGYINTWEVGVYTLTYGAYLQSDQLIVYESRTIIVVDTTPPVITVNGEEIVTLSVGDAYNEYGAWANDTSGDYIEVETFGLEDVNTDVAGVYIITYVAIDASGNEAIETRTVIVENEKVSSIF